jgi:hypothetical protein
MQSSLLQSPLYLLLLLPLLVLVEVVPWCAVLCCWRLVLL